MENNWDVDRDFFMSIEDKFEIAGRGVVVTGRIETGEINVGDTVIIQNVNNSIVSTVRPPKLGGNERVGVFASRSPFRPNHIGLSSVKIEKIDFDENLGTVIYISGADLMNGTPILDIKPYLPYTDSHPDASNGFALDNTDGLLDVICSDEFLKKLPANMIDGLFETLKHDPRPSYQNDSERIYGMSYGDMQVKFKVNNKELIIINIE